MERAANPLALAPPLFVLFAWLDAGCCPGRPEAPIAVAATEGSGSASASSSPTSLPVVSTAATASTPSEPPPEAAPVANAATSSSAAPPASSARNPPAKSETQPGNSGLAASTAPSGATEATKPVRPSKLSIRSVEFTSGDVPKARGAIEKLLPKLEACVDGAGGVSGSTGELHVSFLVRASGVAEGVDVSKAKGVPSEAKSCVVGLLKKRKVGLPSEDPIGVTVTFFVEALPSKDEVR